MLNGNCGMCVCIVFGMFMYVLMVYPVISQAHFGHNEYKNYLDGSQNRKTANLRQL